MQLITFEPKSLFLYVLLFLSSCGYRESQTEAVNTPPTNHTSEEVIEPENSRTLLLLSGDSVYYYRGDSISAGQVYTVATVEGILKADKKELGDKLVVIIKPAPTATYKLTVDVLDIMTIDNIKKFAMVKMSSEEEKYLYSVNLSRPSDLANIQLSTSLATEAVVEYGFGFYIHLKGDETIWYKTDSSYNKINYIQLKNPKEPTLQKAVATFKATGIKEKKGTMVYIIGDKDVIYPEFEMVMAALRKNEIFKYKLINAE
jgi:biopolymer transport protein ExbD